MCGNEGDRSSLRSPFLVVRMVRLGQLRAGSIAFEEKIALILKRDTGQRTPERFAQQPVYFESSYLLEGAAARAELSKPRSSENTKG